MCVESEEICQFSKGGLCYNPADCEFILDAHKMTCGARDADGYPKYSRGERLIDIYDSSNVLKENWQYENYFANSRKLATKLIISGLDILRSHKTTMVEKKQCLDWFAGQDASHFPVTNLPLPVMLCCELLGIDNIVLYNKATAIMKGDRQPIKIERWDMQGDNERGVRKFKFGQRQNVYYNQSDLEAFRKGERVPVSCLTPGQLIIYLHFDRYSMNSINKMTGIPYTMVRGVINEIANTGRL